MLSVEEIWRRYDEVETRLTAGVSERMLDLAGLRPGLRLLDLASGRGEPCLRAAERVGPEGHVLAVEAVEALSAMTRAKVTPAVRPQLELRTGRAEQLDALPEDSFDAATCRWGLMYMEDPPRALANAHLALKPDAPFVAALWAEAERVPYYTLPRRLLREHCEVPEPDPEGPNTFRYASLERIEVDFARAGLPLDHVEELEIAVFEADTPAEMLAWVRALGLEDHVASLPEAQRRSWEEALLAELEPLRRDGALQLGGVTRIVRGRKR